MTSKSELEGVPPNAAETGPGPAAQAIEETETGSGDAGRETVLLAGLDTVCWRRPHPAGGDGVAPPHGRSGPTVPGCVCPACGRAAAIRGGIGSDYIFQAVVAELGTRGVEIDCEGCGHRFVFGAAPRPRRRSRSGKPSAPDSQAPVEPA